MAQLSTLVVMEMLRAMCAVSETESVRASHLRLESRA